MYVQSAAKWHCMYECTFGSKMVDLTKIIPYIKNIFNFSDNYQSVLEIGLNGNA